MYTTTTLQLYQGRRVTLQKHYNTQERSVTLQQHHKTQEHSVHYNNIKFISRVRCNNTKTLQYSRAYVTLQQHYNTQECSVTLQQHYNTQERSVHHNIITKFKSAV